MLRYRKKSLLFLRGKSETVKYSKVCSHKGEAVETSIVHEKCRETGKDSTGFVHAATDR